MSEWSDTPPPSQEEYLRSLRGLVVTTLGVGALDRFDAWLVERDRAVANKAWHQGYGIGGAAPQDGTWYEHQSPYAPTPTCSYTHAHTRDWCGSDTCRES